MHLLHVHGLFGDPEKEKKLEDEVLGRMSHDETYSVLINTKEILIAGFDFYLNIMRGNNKASGTEIKQVRNLLRNFAKIYVEFQKEFLIEVDEGPNTLSEVFKVENFTRIMIILRRIICGQGIDPRSGVALSLLYIQFWILSFFAF